MTALPEEIKELVERQVPSTSRMYRDVLALLEAATIPSQPSDSCITFAPEYIEKPFPGFSEIELKHMAEQQKHSFVWAAKAETVRWLIQKHTPSAKRVLDIGCGTGFITKILRAELPDAALLATDIFTEGVRLASDALKSDAFVFHMDAYRIPFQNELDLVPSFDVLEHIDGDLEVLKKIAASLRPGGVSINIVPQHPWLYSPADARANHVRRYRVRELADKTREAGLDVSYDSSIFSLLLPAAVASRYKSKITGKYHPDDEHNLPTLLSAILGGIQSLELGILKMGIRFPIGNSRVVVSVKSG